MRLWVSLLLCMLFSLCVGAEAPLPSGRVWLLTTGDEVFRGQWEGVSEGYLVLRLSQENKRLFSPADVKAVFRENETALGFRANPYRFGAQLVGLVEKSYVDSRPGSGNVSRDLFFEYCLSESQEIGNLYVRFASAEIGPRMKSLQALVDRLKLLDDPRLLLRPMAYKSVFLFFELRVAHVMLRTQRLRQSQSGGRHSEEITELFKERRNVFEQVRRLGTVIHGENDLSADEKELAQQRLTLLLRSWEKRSAKLRERSGGNLDGRRRDGERKRDG